MIAKRGDRFLVVDLEATCGQRKLRNEMIEIGCVLYEFGAGIISEWNSFVRPILNPTLTKFCRGLTHIEQSDVDSADYFPVALHNLTSWLSDFGDMKFCSWGDYDRHQFRWDCTLHSMKLPVVFRKGNHINLKKEFAIFTNSKSKGLSRALNTVGFKFNGSKHRAIYDARNTVPLLDYILEEGD